MGFLDRVLKWFGRRTKASGGASFSSADLGGLLSPFYSDLPKRGSAELLEAYRTHPWLRTVVHRIAVEVATAAKWELFTEPEGHPQRQQIHAHPLLALFRSPSRRMTAVDVWAFVQMSLDLVGDAFVIIDRNESGFPAELTPIPATWVWRTPSPDSPVFQVSSGGTSALREIPSQNMLWMREVDPANPRGRGVGPAHALANELDTDEYAAKFTAAFFVNGGLPGAVVSIEGGSEKEAIRVEESLRQKHGGGPSNVGKIHVTNKKLSFARLDTSFKDQALVELRKFERDTILQTFGVPPEVFGVIENSNRATIDAAYYLFAKAVLVPRLQLLVSELQMRVVGEYGAGLHLGVVSPVPEDRDFMMRAMAVAPGAFRAGELRRLVGMLPDPDLDAIPLNQLSPVSATPTQLPPGKGGDPAWTAQLPAISLGRKPD
jgi:HK97 family phage portal protein